MTRFVINGSVLLIRRLQPPIASVGGHCGLGIERKGRQSGKYKKVCTTDLLLSGLVLAQHIADMPLSQEALPAHIGTDREASMCTTSAVAIFACKQASTVRLKIMRNRSSPHRWRMRTAAPHADRSR